MNGMVTVRVASMRITESTPGQVALWVQLVAPTALPDSARRVVARVQAALLSSAPARAASPAVEVQHPPVARCVAGAGCAIGLDPHDVGAGVGETRVDPGL